MLFSLMKVTNGTTTSHLRPLNARHLINKTSNLSNVEFFTSLPHCEPYFENVPNILTWNSRSGENVAAPKSPLPNSAFGSNMITTFKSLIRTRKARTFYDTQRQESQQSEMSGGNIFIILIAPVLFLPMRIGPWNPWDWWGWRPSN